MLKRTFGLSLFVTTAVIVGACDMEEPDELDLVLVPSGGPVSGSSDDSGGADSGDSGGESSGGEDEVSAEFDDGVDGPVCQPVELEQLNFMREEGVDDLAAAPDPAAGSLACPWTAGVKSKYVDYSCKEVWNGTAELNCDYFCDCSVHYESPCNPPHASCGADFVDKEGFTSYVGDSPLGMWQCHLQGAIQCQLKNEEYGLKKCLEWCKGALPKRTLECPGCK